PDRDTRLDVGLIKIQPGDGFSEDGADCDAHAPRPDPETVRPALEVGTPDRPIDASHTALIRLIPVEGQDPKTCPALICCGGRMDFHGAPMNRTWVKLGASARKGEADVTLVEPVTGWRPGDRLIVTATEKSYAESGTRRPGARNRDPLTEERTIKAID